MTGGERAARYAVLIDHFHLTPRQIGGLTERQISELYYHARDRMGSIRVPEPRRAPRTEEQHVSAYLRIARQAGFPPEVVEATLARIRAYHASRGEGPAGET